MVHRSDRTVPVAQMTTQLEDPITLARDTQILKVNDISLYTSHAILTKL